MSGCRGERCRLPGAPRTKPYVRDSLGKTDQARAALRRAADRDSDLAEAYVNLGDACFRTGDAAGAIEALRHAIRLKPESASAHNNLATFDPQHPLSTITMDAL